MALTNPDFTYDNYGNPLTHNGKILTWCGTKLVGVDNTDLHYDYNGLRIQKGNKNYYWLGNTLKMESWTENNVEKSIYYYYDQTGVSGFRYDDNDYYYHKNIFGDVLGIYDANGNAVAKYTYSAFGIATVSNLTEDNLGSLNPFRYRSYYWDNEFGLYYLQSRYYDPTIGRFISPDSPEYLDPYNVNGLNLYCYCANNPIMHADPSGHAWYNTLWDWVNTIAGFLNPISTLTAIGSIAVASIGGRWNDVVDDWNNGCLNPFNQSASVALKSKVLSFYKGSTVVRQNILTTCSAFGTIWSNSNDSATDLMHEYGHSVQERLLGINYIWLVVIPSAYYCNFGNYRSITNDTLRDKMYYSKIWERTADWLGGVNRNNYFDFWDIQNFIWWQ